MNRKILIISLFIHFTALNLLFAQQQKYPTLKDLAGVWQRGSAIPGNGLAQNFQFSSDGRFALNLGDIRDDLRVILQIKGRCRLDSNLIFFTIYSKTVLEGNEIGVGDSLDGNIFSIVDDHPKEIKLINPKEIQDGCLIKLINNNHIRIINVDYYKIDLKKYKIDDGLIIKW